MKDNFYYFNFAEEKVKKEFEENLEDLAKFLEGFAENFYILALFNRDGLKNKEVEEFIKSFEERGLPRESVIFLLENPPLMFSIMRTELVKSLSKILYLFWENHNKIIPQKVEIPELPSVKEENANFEEKEKDELQNILPNKKILA
ncbi:MAG: hypothetical protein QXX30_00080 [Candidatus Aenigmatarchaeota archaeon]